MPVLRCSLAATLIVGALHCLPVAAQPVRVPPEHLASIVDSVARRAVADGLAPALGVAITMRGRTILARSYGQLDAQTGARATDATLWYIASTSKSLTGFAVSLLTQSGRMRFSDPITRLLPEAVWHPDVAAASLTLGDFLAHTHHLSDNAVTMSAAFTGAVPERDWPALLAFAQPARDTDLVYSNLGYNVAAMVIDAARPEGWKRYLERVVQRPTGMSETYTRVSGLDRRRIALPHRMTAAGTFVMTPFFKTDATMNAAGGHLATLHDLARWTIVQMDSGRIDGRQVFPTAAVALSHRQIAPQTRANARRFAFFDRDGWGAGWDIGRYEGERMLSRMGGYDALRSHLSFLPGRRIGAVVLSNGGNPALTDVIAALAYDLEAGKPDAMAQLARRMSDIRDRHRAAIANTTVQDSVRAARQRQPLDRPLAAFAASYRAPAYGTITFTARGGTLWYVWGALSGPVELYDAGAHQFRLEIAGSGSIVTFGLDAAGAVSRVTVSGATLHRQP
jgi:CubicO group peptidase (beta-lactamase class C family)